ncbi:MAG: hypothetical protein EPN82_00925 [Bacteroidetes bacterium]|nr:MAG: hypothetical protein EPN82_00925 [Bacteroidota bacterium]
MNRRQFVEGSIFAAGGMVATGRLLAKNSNKINSTNLYTNKNTIDLELLCDDSGIAFDSISSFLKLLNVSNVKIEEHQLIGDYIGDVVFIYNNCLVNYKSDNTKHGHIIRNISETLKLPRKIKNPTLIKAISVNKDSFPKYVNVFSDNKITERYKISEEKKDIHIKAEKGELVFSITNNSVFATHSSCKHKNCIHTGAIRKAGQNIICIPNNIRIALDGNHRRDIDSITF